MAENNTEVVIDNIESQNDSSDSSESEDDANNNNDNNEDDYGIDTFGLFDEDSEMELESSSGSEDDEVPLAGTTQLPSPSARRAPQCRQGRECFCGQALAELLPTYIEWGKHGSLRGAIGLKRYTAKKGKAGDFSATREPVSTASQREFIKAQLLNPDGGYRYCSKRIIETLHISAKRLAKIRKQSQCDVANPCTRPFTISDILKFNLTEAAILPEEDTMHLDLTLLSDVKEWLTHAEPSRILLVKDSQSSINHHNAGRTPNSSHTHHTLAQFKLFISNNSAHNGRSEFYTGLRFYLDASFLSLLPPWRPTEPEIPIESMAVPPTDYQLKNLATWSRYRSLATNSVLNKFNVAQRESGDQEISGTTLLSWMRTHFKGYGIPPHESGVCDTCATFNTIIARCNSTLSRVQQAGGGNRAERIAKVISGLVSLKADHLSLKTREKAAYSSLEADLLRQENHADTLRGNRRIEYLRGIPRCLIFDFQMVRPYPYFGSSPQPSKVYFKQRLAINTGGIVNLNAFLRKDPYFHVLLTEDDSTCKKSTSHMISYLNSFLDKIDANPSDVHRDHLILYFDSAGYFKSSLMLAFLSWLVKTRRCKTVELRFFLSGHSKNLCDANFARISGAACRADIFSIRDVEALWLGKAASVTIYDHHNTYFWKEFFKTTSSFPGIQKYGYFKFFLNRTTNDPQMIYRRDISSGIFGPPITLVGNAIPNVSSLKTVFEARKSKPLKPMKLNSVCAIYEDYIPDRRKWPSVVSRYLGDREGYLRGDYHLPPLETPGVNSSPTIPTIPTIDQISVVGANTFQAEVMPYSVTNLPILPTTTNVPFLPITDEERTNLSDLEKIINAAFVALPHGTTLAVTRAFLTKLAQPGASPHTLVTSASNEDIGLRSMPRLSKARKAASRLPASSTTTPFASTSTTSTSSTSTTSNEQQPQPLFSHLQSSAPISFTSASPSTLSRCRRFSDLEKRFIYRHYINKSLSQAQMLPWIASHFQTPAPSTFLMSSIIKQFSNTSSPVPSLVTSHEINLPTSIPIPVTSHELDLPTSIPIPVTSRSISHQPSQRLAKRPRTPRAQPLRSLSHQIQNQSQHQVFTTPTGRRRRF